MKFFPSRAVFLEIGIFSIRWYAVLILTGALIAYYFAKKNLDRYKNVNTNDFLENAFLIMLWAGLIGARIWFCVFYDFNYYISNPAAIFRIWDGGLAIHGTLTFGALSMFFYCKKRNVSFIKFLDAVLPCVFVGQAFGRWGNFINQECFGNEVSESYFNGILSFLKNGMYINGHYYEPMFFYESIGCLIGFILINFILRKYQNKRGDLTWAYLMWYGLIRFFIEGHRTDSLFIGNLKTAQVTSIIFMLVGILGFVGIFDKYIFKKKKPTLLFDFDGTIIDSEKTIIMTYTELFRRYDKVENFTKEKQAEVLGPGLLEIFPKFFPGQDPQKLFDEYQVIFNEYLKDNLIIMPHAEEVLSSLKADGFNIGIVTTRSTKSTLECMELCKLGSYIDDIICMDDVKKLKPDAEAYIKIVDKNKWNKDDVVVIGDSSADVKGGKNYGAYTIAYLRNPMKIERLKALKADNYIEDLSEILPILKEKHYFTYNGR